MIPDKIPTLIILLTAAHLVGDFLLQTKEDATGKKEPLILLKHAGIVALVSYLMVGIWSSLLVPVGIFLSHAIVDPLKLTLQNRTGNTRRARLILFVVDQGIHLIVIVAIASLLAGRVVPEQIYWVHAFGHPYLVISVLFGGAILATKVGAIVVGMYVEPYLEQLERLSGDDEPGRRGFIEGGRTIGYLERFLIYLFILVGFPLGIGFLITAKSVFRFGEVNNPAHRMEAEYIIIGTLLSFAYAISVGYIVSTVLGSIPV
jgi:hypothetical protein